MAEATRSALRIVRDVRELRGIETQSPINLVLTDGRSLVATRYVFDYGWYPEDGSFFAGEREHDFTTLWYTAGAGYGHIDGDWCMDIGGPTTSVMVASEPLSEDTSTWRRAPEYTMLVADPGADGVIDLSLKEIVL